jgi:hypothetical protein
MAIRILPAAGRLGSAMRSSLSGSRTPRTPQTRPYFLLRMFHFWSLVWERVADATAEVWDLVAPCAESAGTFRYRVPTISADDRPANWVCKPLTPVYPSQAPDYRYP